MVQLEDKTYEELIQTREELVKERKAQVDKIRLLEAEVQWYKQQFGLAQKRLYGPSSEKSPHPEGTLQEVMLFNEAEACASPTLPDLETESITYTRRKSAGKRQKQLEDLPIEEIEYELTEDEQVCPECAGALHKMGADVSQEIKIVPAQVILVKHNRGKYACRQCERNEIKTPIVSAGYPLGDAETSLSQ